MDRWVQILGGREGERERGGFALKGKRVFSNICREQ